MAEWTDERRDQAIRLWNDGLSATEIAAIMRGVSRNAIIGMVHRARPRGLVTRALASKLEIGQRSTKARVENAGGYAPRGETRLRIRTQVAPKPLPDGPIVTDATHAKPWTERGFNECAFPISGSGEGTFSCCVPTGGRTYCGFHRAIMFAAPRPPKVRAYRPKRAA